MTFLIAVQQIRPFESTHYLRRNADQVEDTRREETLLTHFPREHDHVSPESLTQQQSSEALEGRFTLLLMRWNRDSKKPILRYGSAPSTIPIGSPLYNRSLPVFPSVHTLQLCQLPVHHYTNDVFSGEILTATFPSLILHGEDSNYIFSFPIPNGPPFIYHVPSRVHEFENNLRAPIFANQLEALRVIETPFSNIKTWESWEGFLNLKHITLGVIAHGDTTFGKWKPPKTLETLSLLVGCNPAAQVRTISLEQVYNCLVASGRPLSRNLTHLRSLQLHLVPVHAPDEPVPPLDMVDLSVWIKKIEHLCSWWKVKFSYESLGEFSFAFIHSDHC